jgi:hypothetical protein
MKRGSMHQPVLEREEVTTATWTGMDIQLIGMRSAVNGQQSWIASGGGSSVRTSGLQNVSFKNLGKN